MREDFFFCVWNWPMSEKEIILVLGWRSQLRLFKVGDRIVDFG